MIRLLVVAIFLVGCASRSGSPQDYLEGIVSPIDRVLVGREMLSEDPGNVRLSMVVREAELDAIQYYTAMGDHALRKSDYDLARQQYKEGLGVDPQSKHLLSKLELVDSTEVYRSELGVLEKKIGNQDYIGAKAALLKAMATGIGSEELGFYDVKIRNALARERDRDLKIDLNFDKIDFPAAIRFVGDAFGVNVVVDSSVKDTPVSLEAADVGFEWAFVTLLSMTKNAFKVVDESTVLVFSDSADRRKQFEDLQLRTYHLNSIPAKEMVTLLKGALDLNKVTVNESANTLLVRDSSKKLDIVDLLVRENDSSRGEVVLEVEILEINLSNTERLGVDYGSYSLGLPIESSKVTESIAENLADNALLNVPAVAMRFFKQDVDATTLANPRVRVMDGEKAKIHIGDRVPLRAAQIQDATGQTRTTFEYQEIGIRLQVEPRLHSDDYVTINLALEVSSLGENLGTANEPAYRIGTRNAETIMHVRSGETAILGGLIREEERGTLSQVEGLSRIPAVGALFESSDDSDARTDVLLTITPKIVRSAPVKHAGRISIGTENQFSLGGVSSLSELKLRKPEPPVMVDKKAQSLEVVFEGELSTDESVLGDDPIRSNGSHNDSPSKAESGVTPAKEGISLRPKNEEYSLAVDENLSIPIVPVVGMDGVDLSYNLVFNPAILDYVGFESSVNDSSVEFNGSNTLTVRTGKVADLQALEVLFKGKRSGRSFVLVRAAEVADQVGQGTAIETGGARVTVSD